MKLRCGFGTNARNVQEVENGSRSFRSNNFPGVKRATVQQLDDFAGDSFTNPRD